MFKSVLKRVEFTYTLLYLIFDYFASVVATLLFLQVKHAYNPSRLSFYALLDKHVLTIFLFLPAFWLLYYFLRGDYTQILRKSRFFEILVGLKTTFFGSLLIYFAYLINDTVTPYPFAVFPFLLFWFLNYTTLVLPRYFITKSVVKSIHRNQIEFPALLVGNVDEVNIALQDLGKSVVSMGHRVMGYVSLAKIPDGSIGEIRYFGTLAKLPDLIERLNVREVIVAHTADMHECLEKVLIALSDFPEVALKVIPDNVSILTGQAKIESLLGSSWVSVDIQAISPWQEALKRLIDITFSICALFLLSPLILAIALAIRLDSKGKVFFRQERIGLFGKPFNIIKFRTMHLDAERDGIKTSAHRDKRITQIGRFLRKTRLDEIPQFINVLKGEMSIVGPRPERQYFIDKIVAIAPYYKLLHRVKPGITSWGQIRYGYAETVDEMVERLRYDLTYMRNFNLALDFKIMLYTASIMLRGRGQ